MKNSKLAVVMTHKSWLSRALQTFNCSCWKKCVSAADPPGRSKAGHFVSSFQLMFEMTSEGDVSRQRRGTEMGWEMKGQRKWACDSSQFGVILMTDTWRVKCCIPVIIIIIKRKVDAYVKREALSVSRSPCAQASVVMIVVHWDCGLRNWDCGLWKNVEIERI